MKKLKKIIKTNREEKGFTLVEVLFSFLLLLIAILFMTNIIIYSLEGNKKSRIRLEVSQKLVYCKNQLLSKSFDSEELKDGHTSIDEPLFRIDWNINSISPTLKKIKLSILYKTLKKQIYFYKSKYIKEVKND